MIHIQEGGVNLAWYTLYDMHDNVWECIRRSHNAWSCMWWESMRMTENARERLMSKEGWWVIIGWHTLYDMDNNECECMRMTENAGEWLILREGWWVILGWVALYDMHDNVWECMIMTDNGGAISDGIRQHPFAGNWTTPVLRAVPGVAYRRIDNLPSVRQSTVG